MRLQHFKQNILYFLFLIIIIVAVNACSTKKNKWINKQYHTVVSKYNGYFNGRESLKEGIADLERAHEDKYDDILHIYRLGSEQQAQSVYPKMDRAIEKAIKVIRKNSMTFRGIEYIKWVKESYMMIGDANFYKKEYEMASETYDFIIRLYHYSPIRYEAYIKSAITNNITGNYGKSLAMLEQLEGAKYNGELKRRQIHRYHKAYADYHIRNSMYEEATRNLTDAIKTTRRKKERVRLNYILGQVYMRTGNLAEASKAFNRVIRMSPPYEMEFNAKISAAMCYDAASGDSKNLIELLTKMLRDDKNKDYLDQIYFALAQIAIKDNNTEKAIEYLKLSTETSVSNSRQKAISFHTLAELYFEMPDYFKSGIYYDSTMAFLPKDYNDYAAIEAKHKVLSELVKNLKIINLEDSLQRLAGMSERERIALVDGIIAEIVAEERRRQEEERERMLSMQMHGQHGQQGQQFGQQAAGGAWYFYNPQAVSFGFTEFRRKWGERKLEDNWRLSNKEMVFDFADSSEDYDEDGADSTGTKASNDPKDRNTYLRNIPTTPEMLERSHNKIISALYACGTIYKEGLKEYVLSNKSFEDLLKRYPDNKYALNTYYHLYRTYDQINNKAQSDYYKNLILSKYPDSEHAKLINDPGYFQRKSLQQDEAEVFYAQVYQAYLDNNCAAVMTQAEEGKKRFTGSKTEAKFAYLKGLCIGKTKTKEEFETYLKSFVETYSKSELKPMAQNILDYMQGAFELTAEKSLKAESKAASYVLNDSTIHFYALIVDAKKINVNQLKIKLSDYNAEYHRFLNLTISNVFLDDVRQIITIANFPNRRAGMNYYNAVSNHKDLLKSYNPSDYSHFIITVENYPIFYKDKDIAKYLDFFNKNYIR